MNYWINTISKDHVMRGVDGGFMQAGHGKSTKLKILKNDDWIVFYSPKMALEGGDTLQSFTAIGQIDDEEPYQIEMTSDFHPWRRNVTFYECSEMPIRPLINDLSFIADKTHWGYMFRFGLFPISEKDFDLIKKSINLVE